MSFLFKIPSINSINISKIDTEPEKNYKDAEVQTVEKMWRIPKLCNHNKKELLKKKRNKEIVKTPKSGRKKLIDQSIRKHSKYSNDNCIYKIKNKSFNCIIYTLNKLLKQISNQEQFKKIKSSYLKDCTKLYNEQLLKTKIKDILLFDVSSKYSLQNKNNNQEIINKYSSNELIYEILNMEYEDCIDNLFMMSSNDFQKKYSFDNKFLFEKAIKDKKEYLILKQLIDEGIVNYFKNIKPRKLRKKDSFDYTKIFQKNF
jgi:hypothetical protein